MDNWRLKIGRRGRTHDRGLEKVVKWDIIRLHVRMFVCTKYDRMPGLRVVDLMLFGRLLEGLKWRLMLLRLLALLWRG